jgi:hypothetical protein
MGATEAGLRKPLARSAVASREHVAAGPDRPPRDAAGRDEARSEMWGAPSGGWAPSHRGEGAADGAAGVVRSPFASRDPGSLACHLQQRLAVAFVASFATKGERQIGRGDWTARPTHGARHGGHRGVGHNATPEEDYRTALLSDSPDAGVRYASPVGGQRKRPGRQAGRRYSAGRAQGGRGRFLLRGTPTSAGTRTRACGAGPRHQCIGKASDTTPSSARWKKNQNKHKQNPSRA